MNSQISQIAVVKIERKRDDKGRFWLDATLSNGNCAVFGWGQTDAGSKRMLTIHAKRRGLTVNGNTAA